MTFVKQFLTIEADAEYNKPSKRPRGRPELQVVLHDPVEVLIRKFTRDYIVERVLELDLTENQTKALIYRMFFIVSVLDVNKDLPIPQQALLEEGVFTQSGNPHSIHYYMSQATVVRLLEEWNVIYMTSPGVSKESGKARYATYRIREEYAVTMSSKDVLVKIEKSWLKFYRRIVENIRGWFKEFLPSDKQSHQERSLAFAINNALWSMVERAKNVLLHIDIPCPDSPQFQT